MSSSDTARGKKLRFGIQDRVILWLLILGIFPVIATSLLGHWVLSRSVTETAGERLLAVAGGLSSAVDQHIRELVRTTSEAALELPLAGRVAETEPPAIRDWPADSARAVSLILARPLSAALAEYHMLNREALDLLLLTDTEGAPLAASGPLNQSSFPVRAARAGTSAAVPASELRFDGQRRRLVVAVPVLSGERVVGYVQGMADIAGLVPLLDNVGPGQTGFAALLSDSGEVLLAAAGHEVSATTPADWRARLDADHPRWFVGSSLSGRGSAFVALSPVSSTATLARGGAVGWTAWVEQAGAEVLAPVRQFGRNAVFVFLVTAAIVMVVGLYLSERIVRPLRELRNGARRIGSGELDFAIGVSTGDEIGELAGEFTSMARRLKESYQGLEERVRTATAELARQRDSLQSILTAVGEGLMVVDTEHRIRVWNRAAEHMTGYTQAEANGRTCQELLHTGSEQGEFCHQLCPVETALADCRTVSGRDLDTFLVTRSGRRLPVSVTASPLLGEKGQPQGCVVVLRDISQEREIDRFKSEMISTVGHELRTPLGPLIGFAELLREARLPDDQRDKYLCIIVEQGRRLAGLVDNFLALSRIEAGRLELNLQPVDLAAIAEEIVAIESRHNPNHRLTCELPEGFPQVRGDYEWLKRVVHNLVSNAIKYSPRGGPVRIGGRDLGPEVELSVADSGIGIRKEDVPKLFHRFSRVNREATPEVAGTGLGLSICRHVITEHRGTISVQSEYGKGSTFVIRLPRSGPPAS